MGMAISDTYMNPTIVPDIAASMPPSIAYRNGTPKDSFVGRIANAQTPAARWNAAYTINVQKRVNLQISVV